MKYPTIYLNTININKSQSMRWKSLSSSHQIQYPKNQKDSPQSGDGAHKISDAESILQVVSNSISFPLTLILTAV